MGKQSTEGTIHNYYLHFEQVVGYKIETLKIGELNVIPYEYKDVDESSLFIEAKITLLKEQMDVLNKMKETEDYFYVIRYRISDKVLKMRLSKNILSEKNIEDIKAEYKKNKHI